MDIEAEIISTEERISELEIAMCDLDVYTDAQKMRQLTEEYNRLKTELEKLYERWA